MSLGDVGRAREDEVVIKSNATNVLSVTVGCVQVHALLVYSTRVSLAGQGGSQFKDAVGLQPPVAAASDSPDPFSQKYNPRQRPRC